MAYTHWQPESACATASTAAPSVSANDNANPAALVFTTTSTANKPTLIGSESTTDFPPSAPPITPNDSPVLPAKSDDFPYGSTHFFTYFDMPEKSLVCVGSRFAESANRFEEIRSKLRSLLDEKEIPKAHPVIQPLEKTINTISNRLDKWIILLNEWRSKINHKHNPFGFLHGFLPAKHKEESYRFIKAVFNFGSIPSSHTCFDFFSEDSYLNKFGQEDYLNQLIEWTNTNNICSTNTMTIVASQLSDLYEHLYKQILMQDLAILIDYVNSALKSEDNNDNLNFVLNEMNILLKEFNQQEISNTPDFRQFYYYHIFIQIMRFLITKTDGQRLQEDLLKILNMNQDSVPSIYERYKQLVEEFYIFLNEYCIVSPQRITTVSHLYLFLNSLNNPFAKNLEKLTDTSTLKASLAAFKAVQDRMPHLIKVSKLDQNTLEIIGEGLMTEIRFLRERNQSATQSEALTAFSIFQTARLSHNKPLKPLRVHLFPPALALRTAAANPQPRPSNSCNLS